jgi:hypothetical protein
VNNVNITNTRVNVTQVTNVYNNYTTNNVTKITYVNQRVPTAVTAVSHDTFVNARPVARNLAQVDARQIAEAPVSHMAPVQPERTSVVGAGAPVRARPPAAIENRHVVATRNPTPPRAPFEQRQATNVRPETPGQPAPRPEAPRPEAPVVKTQPDEHRNVPRPSAPGRTEEPPQVSRQPEAPRPEMPRPEPQPAPRPAQGYQNRGSETPTHPLVRPAPPVQSRPQVDQNEANKFRNWQQQRPSPPPANVPRPPANRPPQKEERKK